MLKLPNNFNQNDFLNSEYTLIVDKIKEIFLNSNFKDSFSPGSTNTLDNSKNSSIRNTIIINTSKDHSMELIHPLISNFQTEGITLQPSNSNIFIPSPVCLLPRLSKKSIVLKEPMVSKEPIVSKESMSNDIYIPSPICFFTRLSKEPRVKEYLIEPMDVKVKLILSKDKRDNSNYSIEIDLDTPNLRVNISKDTLIELNTGLENYRKIIEKRNAFDKFRFGNTHVNNTKDEVQIKRQNRFIQLQQKLDRYIKKRKILENIIRVENLNLRIDSSIAREAFDKYEYSEFCLLLDNLDVDLIFYALKSIQIQKLQLQNEQIFEPFSSLFLFPFINLNYFDEESSSFKKEIRELHKEMTLIKEDIVNDFVSNKIRINLNSDKLTMILLNQTSFDMKLELNNTKITLNNSERIFDFGIDVSSGNLSLAKIPYPVKPLVSRSSAVHHDQEGTISSFIMFSLLNVKLVTRLVKEINSEQDERFKYNFELYMEKISLISDESHELYEGCEKIIINENEIFDLSKENSIFLEVKFEKYVDDDTIQIYDSNISIQNMILNQNQYIELLYTINRLHNLSDVWLPYEIEYDHKMIQKFSNITKSIFKSNCGVKLDVGDDKFLLLPKKMEVNFDVKILLADVQEQKFQVIFQNCYLYHYGNGNHIKLSNPFDFSIIYTREPSYLKLSELTITIPPIKLISNQYNVSNIISFLENFTLPSDMKMLNFISNFD